MTTQTHTTAEIEKWHRIRVRLLTNVWHRVRKKNTESCRIWKLLISGLTISHCHNANRQKMLNLQG